MTEITRLRIKAELAARDAALAAARAMDAARAAQAAAEVAARAAQAAQAAEAALQAAQAAQASRIAAQANFADFAEAFRQAFTRLDRRNGGNNFVRLLELRQALPQFDRATFDAGLNQLRRQWEFSLEAHEGLHVQISPEERESGIPEMGTLLIYVSRRRS